LGYFSQLKGLKSRKKIADESFLRLFEVMKKRFINPRSRFGAGNSLVWKAGCPTNQRRQAE
jgi:hypothetical protein